MSFEALPPPPLVSVVTPTYNQGQFIEETIRSVLLQDYPNLEYIVIDGGSTDCTLDILRRYEGNRNMRWISEPDGGMYEAVNKGLRLSHGGVLAYLNSDDRYFPWTVAAAVQALAEHPDSGLVFGDMLVVNEKTDAGSLRTFPPFRLDYIRRSGYLGQPTVFWRRAVLDQFGGFDEKLKFVADCEYWMRIGGRYRAHKVNEVLAIERDHPEAKRFAQEQALHKELVEVRSRYVRPGGLGYRAHVLADHAYAFLWRRCYLSGFLYACIRARNPSKHNPNHAWAHFAGSQRAKVSWWYALATFLPFIGTRFSRSMVRL